MKTALALLAAVLLLAAAVYGAGWKWHGPVQSQKAGWTWDGQQDIIS
jgi:hypothetical protein